MSTTTCGSTISTNTTYIRNPGYPSSYTASSAGSCSFTIKKVADDICQLRLDFQTFSGFATTSPAGACDDTFAATGQTGSDPPSICGTNTGYHSKKIATKDYFFHRNTSLLIDKMVNYIRIGDQYRSLITLGLQNRFNIPLPLYPYTAILEGYASCVISAIASD